MVFLLSFFTLLQVCLQSLEVRIIFRNDRFLLLFLFRVWNKILPFRIIVTGLLPQAFLRLFPHLPTMLSFLPALLLVLVVVHHYFQHFLPLLQSHRFLLTFETVRGLYLILPSTKVTKVFEILTNTFPFMTFKFLFFNLLLLSQFSLLSFFPILLSQTFEMIELLWTDFIFSQGFDLLVH